MSSGVIIDNNISPILILRSFKVLLNATGNTPVNQTTLAPTSESTGRELLPSSRQSQLPSTFLARRHLTSSSSSKPTAKKRRVSGQIGKEKTFMKDIVCLIQQEYNALVDDNSIFPIPRGKARGKLAELGLIGKVRLVSTWSNSWVTEEITNVFSTSFGLAENEQLQFQYLSVVPGAKVLSFAKVSSSFTWTGHAVSSLAGQGCIYIMTESVPPKMALKKSIKEESSTILVNDSDSEHEVLDMSFYQSHYLFST